jgi:hypothetical protein
LLKLTNSPDAFALMQEDGSLVLTLDALYECSNQEEKNGLATNTVVTTPVLGNRQI